MNFNINLFLGRLKNDFNQILNIFNGNNGGLQPIDQIKSSMKNEVKIICIGLFSTFILLFFIDFESDIFMYLCSFLLTIAFIINSYYMYIFYSFYKKSNPLEKNIYRNLLSFYTEFKYIIHIHRLYKLLHLIVSYPLVFIIFLNNKLGSNFIDYSNPNASYRLALLLFLMIIVIFLNNEREIYFKYNVKLKAIKKELDNIEF